MYSCIIIKNVHEYEVKKEKKERKGNTKYLGKYSAAGVLDLQRASCASFMNINSATNSIEQKASQPGLSRIERWLNTSWAY